MNVADESQWDEAVCTLAGCQHPQCWASLRRIERGHPRIMDTSPKSPRETEDKLPTLTIVNIMDTCLWTKKKVVQPQLSEFTFPKDRSSWLKPAFKRESRSRKALHDKDVTSRSPRPPKLSVLNLNEAKLPFSEDVRHMVMRWVPEETEKTVRPRQKTAVPSWPAKKRKKKLGEKSKLPLYYPGQRHSRSPAVIVPPPSPAHLLDQLSSESIPLWAQVDMLPQELLMECFLAHEKSIACPEEKLEVSKMRKSLPLEESQPESAISSEMCLTVQRLTLQRPSLRYPDRLRKKGFLKHQGKAKTSTLQEAKKKAKRYGEETRSRRFFHDHVEFSISGQESEQKLLEEGEMDKKPKQRHVSLEEAYEFGTYYTEYYTSPESKRSSLSDVIYETIYQDLDDNVDTVKGVDASSKDSSPKNLSEITNKIGWNPELKLLRILQASEEEDEENHLSGAQSETSLQA